MKKLLLIAMVAAASISFVSIGSAQEGTVTDSAAVETNPAGTKTYVCDKCQVSMDEAGKCPVCGNDLVEKRVEERDIQEDQIKSAPDGDDTGDTGDREATEDSAR
ncbi:MAG TPA: hypothetical protein P5287_05660 [bacterium]|nr:hypothetical protein [bacterium]